MMIDINDKDAFVLMLRSKTAFGRLTDTEVHSVLDYLKNIGFATATAPAPIFAPLDPVTVLTPEIQQTAQVSQVMPELVPLAPPPAL
jgi:hypothetical protein